MNDLLYWLSEQWFGESFARGTWYNVPAVLMMIIAGLVALGSGIVAFIEDDRGLARLSLATLFLAVPAAVVWPLLLPLLALVGLGYLVKLAW